MKTAVNAVYVLIALFLLHMGIFTLMTVLEQRGVRIPHRIRRHFLPPGPPPGSRPRR